MIRYIGSDEYEVKIGSIDGVFLREDLINLVDELTDINKEEEIFYEIYNMMDDKYFLIIKDSYE